MSCLSFCWARCASARGRTTGRGKSSLPLRSPLSLRFSPCALPLSLPSPLYALQSFRIPVAMLFLFYHRTGSGIGTAHCAAELRGNGVQESGGTGAKTYGERGNKQTMFAPSPFPIGLSPPVGSADSRFRFPAGSARIQYRFPI